MLEIFQHTLFPNALDGILHCCPCYIQQFGNLPNCHPHLTMMWGVDDHIFLYCYHLSFHTLPFIVLVLSLQTFPNVNSSMLFICWDNFSTSLLNFSLVILAYTWVVFMFLWPSIELTDSIGTPLERQTEVANEWRLMCQDSGLVMPHFLPSLLSESIQLL